MLLRCFWNHPSLVLPTANQGACTTEGHDARPPGQVVLVAETAGFRFRPGRGLCSAGAAGLIVWHVEESIIAGGHNSRQPIAGLWPTFLHGGTGSGFTLLTCPAWKGRRVHLSFRTAQHTGHPHPVLSRSTSGFPALSPTGSVLTELGPRLLPALCRCCLWRKLRHRSSGFGHWHGRQAGARLI